MNRSGALQVETRGKGLYDITREIANELCISRKTVDTHLYRIHRKLGLRTSAELVRLASGLGLTHAGRTREGASAIASNGEAPAGQWLEEQR